MLKCAEASWVAFVVAFPIVGEGSAGVGGIGILNDLWQQRCGGIPGPQDRVTPPFMSIGERLKLLTERNYRIFRNYGIGPAPGIRNGTVEQPMETE